MKICGDNRGGPALLCKQIGQETKEQFFRFSNTDMRKWGWFIYF